MTGRKRLPRSIIRMICLASASALLWPVLPWANSPKFFAQISPFTAICSSVALRKLGAGALIGILIACVTLFRRRWFCRYICPTGLLLEAAAALGLRKTSWWSRCPHLGRYAALLTLAGAVVGYPVLLWMDPLSIFSSSFSVRGAASVTAGVLGGFGLTVLVLLALTSGSIWCARICPLGGTQELLAGAKARWDLWRNKDSEVLTPAEPAGLPYLARRAFILGAAGTGMGWLARALGSARGEDAPLRPPGAVEEGIFTGRCTRCGNCIRICPAKIIRPDTGQAGLAGLLSPTIRYGGNYCLEDCCACTQVCPSGAIQQMDLKKKRQYVIGEALVDGALCLVTLGRKDCDACVRSCPFDAVHMHWDEELYVAYPVVVTERCNGCGACESVCPIQPPKAIRIWKSGNPGSDKRKSL